MKLHIAAEGLELTPEIREVVTKKFSMKISKFVKKYPEDAVKVRMRIKKRARWGFRVRCDLDIPGENIYAEETHKEVSFAVSALAKEVAQRLQKQKEKSLIK